MGKPTKELRAKLDELGVKWWPDVYYRDTNTCWRVGDFEWRASEKKDGKLLIGCTCVKYLTPEQAIAATVGRRTNLSKRLRKVNGMHAFAELFGFSWEDGSDWTWHDVACAMADAVDAQTAGTGTCQGEIDSDYFECKLTTFKCRSCGWSGVVDDGYAGYSFEDTDMPRHCPNFGAKVVAE